MQLSSPSQKATYEASGSRYHSTLQGIYIVHHIRYKYHTVIGER